MRVETRRLSVRPWEHRDAPGLLSAIESDRNSLLPWLPWAATDNRDLPECHYTIEEFRRTMATPECDMYVFGIFERATGMALGGAGFHRLDRRGHGAEIGWWMRADRRGEGFVTEAVSGLVTLLLRPARDGGWGFRRCFAYSAADNEPSLAVARRLGLREEGHFLRDRWLDGLGWRDTVLFAVLAEEWDPSLGRGPTR
jgi:RimJ/RimL family protein N-acetyltransferase